MKSFMLTAAILLALQACDSAKAPPQTTQPLELSAGRFIPIASPSALFDGIQPAHFALDTSSGRLCKPWEWNVPENELNALPICYRLARVEVWERGPDGKIRKKADPLGILEPAQK